MVKRVSLGDIETFHRMVDSRVRYVTEVQEERIQCKKGCSECCDDELTVFRVEADLIRKKHSQLIQHSEPHPEGRCAMLDKNGNCRIYADRPYVCRTQGLPLRWFEPLNLEEIVEYRDICPKNEGGDPLEEMPESFFWTIGEMEGRLAELQTHYTGNQERVPLRQLFQSKNRD